ncbi:hypothetical protein D8674_022252 [Pyrus ussuriensis x Pyrus communis]|uniref:Uncharacterized protein n=1 Tax=Pyrus ussuriensis x Pyrus communis TaxID=2448454 RepID=A0A5N5GY30_9ROSA|nr:hypothetical protein D8674_022252 [Pyrus ussuriensis x Pyrus communis]
MLGSRYDLGKHNLQMERRLLQIPNWFLLLTLHRTVTNVGPLVLNYHAIVSPFKAGSPPVGGLVWKDGVQRVRSPIVVLRVPPP